MLQRSPRLSVAARSGQCRKSEHVADLSNRGQHVALESEESFNG